MTLGVPRTGYVPNVGHTRLGRRWDEDDSAPVAATPAAVHGARCACRGPRGKPAPVGLRWPGEGDGVPDHIVRRHAPDCPAPVAHDTAGALVLGVLLRVRVRLLG